jgi:hypothetical protein
MNIQYEGVMTGFVNIFFTNLNYAEIGLTNHEHRTMSENMHGVRCEEDDEPC